MTRSASTALGAVFEGMRMKMEIGFGGEPALAPRLGRSRLDSVIVKDVSNETPDFETAMIPEWTAFAV